MIVSPPSTARRGAIVGFAVAVALYLAYFSVRSARSTYYTELQTLYGYERATQTEPGNAHNWYLLGRYLQYSLEDADPQRAISSYLKSLEIDNRAPLTWLDLAATYESDGDDRDARKAYASAKKAYPLSAEVSWRYGNFLLRQGEMEPAFAEIRRSVVADPTRSAEAFSRCVRVEPDADVILDRVLPPSRDVYLAVIQDLTADRQLGNALKVWNRLVAMRAKINVQDVFVLVPELRQMGQGKDAQRVWGQAVELAGLANLEGPKNSAMWDGGFESDVTEAGYAWRFAHNTRTQIGFDSQEKYSGKRSMRVSFDGSSDINFRDVCQTVPVVGGTSYNLSGWMQTKELTTDEGVRLELRPGMAGETGTKTTDVRGTQPWTRFETAWDGVKDDQDVEVCLRREPSAQEDNKIRGTVWVDDVALTPMHKSSAPR